MISLTTIQDILVLDPPPVEAAPIVLGSHVTARHPYSDAIPCEPPGDHS